MVANYLNSCEEITDVYSGFALKENWREAGLKALAECKEDIVSAPVLQDGKIRMTLAINYLYDDEDLLNIAWDCEIDVDTEAEARAALPEEAEMVYGADVEIALREENGRLCIAGVKADYCVLDRERKHMKIDWELDLDEVDEDYLFSMLEAFLDAAVMS